MNMTTKAILAEVGWGEGYKRLGWIPREFTHFIDPILDTNSYIHVSVKHIRFSVVLNKIGHYIAVNVTKEGE